MANVGKSAPRVDGYDKATGRAKYTDDLCDKKALIIKVVRSTIAHGQVKAIDISEALKVPGVVKVITCFEVPDIKFPTAGHPWSTDPHHQDIADRKLLNTHVRYYGDDVALVVAENEVAAAQGARLVKVEYEKFDFVLDPLEALKTSAPQIQEDFKGNVLARTTHNVGDYEQASREPGLICVDKWYETPLVQHCPLENPIVYAHGEGGRLVVVSSTQIPHIVRRTVGQALGLPWGKVRVIKPYIGGGFGNKQDTLYEPLAAYVSQCLGGRLVKLDLSREEAFVNTRVRHAFKCHVISWVRPDGTYAARKLELYSNQGAYASHGHSVAGKAVAAFHQMYPCPNVQSEAVTVYTNLPAAGAMRGYGIPQIMFALESHTDDVCAALGRDPLDFRRQNIMPQGYVDHFSKNENYFDTFNQCADKAVDFMDYHRKKEEYKQQSGPIRRGLGLSYFWYNTGVWPIALEHSSCRMVLNEDGSLQLQLGETEIGQGADTAFAQMAADAVGLKDYKDVHVVSTQDTDVTPFGLGAYASRQTYVCGFAIRQTASILREKIISYAHWLTRVAKEDLGLVEGQIVRQTDGRRLLSLAELANEAFYSLEDSRHLTAEHSAHIKNNAYSFGCCLAEVEVDIPMCKARVIKIINVHDCGALINPALAEAQVHGGMSMGLGFGLSEQMLFDPQTGAPLNNNLLDYKLGTTMDHPPLEAKFVENFEPTSPFGTKALGEPPTTPVAPAIRNAILNATGVAIDQLPLNPHTLFKRFKEEGLI